MCYHCTTLDPNSDKECHLVFNKELCILENLYKIIEKQCVLLLMSLPLYSGSHYVTGPLCNKE